MKKFSNKILISTLITLCIISLFSFYAPVSAYDGGGNSNSINSYVSTSFSFTGSCSIAYQCSGYWLNVSVNATASNNNNETITLDIYLVNRNTTKTYTFYSDGQTHSFNNIFLGLSGGSPVRFTFTGANPAITISGTLTFKST